MTLPSPSPTSSSGSFGSRSAVSDQTADRGETVVVAPSLPWVAPEIRLLELVPADPDPYLICPNCGTTMYERGCKLRCRCGYFLSCSDI